jgi:hypothetical protein
MSPTRREFLRAGAAIAGASLIVPAALPASVAGEPVKTSARGLLFGKSDVPRIRTTLALPRFEEFWKTVQNPDHDADRKFLREQLRLNNHAKDFLQARQILERTSFAYAVTGEKEQWTTAHLAIQRILEYVKWDYFLEGGKDTIGLQRAPETTIAMCCAREWLDDVLSAEEKGAMEKQIAEKGAPACYRTLYGMKYPERVKGWGFDPEDDYPYRFDLSRWPLILNSTNLKVIPIAGLGMAGCLLYDQNPQARRWVDLALQSARAFSVMFGPDGSYDEGVGYWGYTASHLTLLVEVLHRRLGLDERKIINFPGTVRYGLRMDMPTAARKGDCVNFGDAWSMGEVAVAAWTAREFRDPIAQYVAANVGEIKSHLAAIWYDPNLKPKTPGPDLHDVRFSNDVVVARTGWTAADTVVALRSGGPANHEHADRNSVLFKAYGERLFHDPFKAAYSYTDPHWKLRLTESHTAILIDGKGHQYHDGHEGTNASWAEARVLRYEEGKGRLVVTSDATEAYQLVNPDVVQVRRTLVFVKPAVVLLFDRVKLKTNPLPVQTRFQIDNSDGKGSAQTSPQGFVVERPLARMYASIESTGTVTVAAGMLQVPEQYGVHPFVEVASHPALDHAMLTMCVALKPGEKDPRVVVAKETGVWNIEFPAQGKTGRLSIRIEEDLPTVTFG